MAKNYSKFPFCAHPLQLLNPRKRKKLFLTLKTLYHEIVWETECLCKTIGTTRLSCQAFVNVL